MTFSFTTYSNIPTASYQSISARPKNDCEPTPKFNPNWQKVNNTLFIFYNNLYLFRSIIPPVRSVARPSNRSRSNGWRLKLWRSRNGRYQADYKYINIKFGLIELLISMVDPIKINLFCWLLHFFFNTRAMYKTNI